MNCKKKKGGDIYSDISYHLFSSFEWRIYHGMQSSKFNVVDQVEGVSVGTD